MRVWIQRAVVIAIWVAALLIFGSYQSANGLSATETGQRFIDAVDAAWWGVFAFVGVYQIRPVVLFPASILTVMGGLLFGPWIGVIVVIVAANTSAMVAYGVGRLLTRQDDDGAGDDPGFVERWSQKLRDNSFTTVFIMRLIFLPYDLVNYLCGALRIRWTSFLLATALGSLPGTISFVLIGASIERLDEGFGGINPWTIVAGVAIFVISLAISRVVTARYATTPDPTPEPA